MVRALCKRPLHPPTTSDKLQQSNDAGVDDSIRLDPPSMSQLSDTIKKLPSGRAPSADGVTAEMMKAALTSVILWLEHLCCFIWAEERVPGECRAILSFSKNKGDRWSTTSYCPITLLSVLGMVITAVLSRIRHLYPGAATEGVPPTSVCSLCRPQGCL